MKAADEFQQISSSLFFWQAYEPAVKADLSCCAILLPGGLVFVDPIPLAKEALSELSQLAPPLAIILTNGNHERASSSFKRQFGIPVYAEVGATELAPDCWIQEDGELFGSLRVISLPGFGPGEIAIYLNEDGGSVLLGDAIINFGSHGFSLLPDKYCTDPKLGRESLRKLRVLHFQRMTFAHGNPVITGAKSRFEQLLATSH